MNKLAYRKAYAEAYEFTMRKLAESGALEKDANAFDSVKGALGAFKNLLLTPRNTGPVSEEQMMNAVQRQREAAAQAAAEQAAAAAAAEAAPTTAAAQTAQTAAAQKPPTPASSGAPASAPAHVVSSQAAPTQQPAPSPQAAPTQQAAVATQQPTAPAPTQQPTAPAQEQPKPQAKPQEQPKRQTQPHEQAPSTGKSVKAPKRGRFSGLGGKLKLLGGISTIALPVASHIIGKATEPAPDPMSDASYRYF